MEQGNFLSIDECGEGRYGGPRLIRATMEEGWSLWDGESNGRDTSKRRPHSKGSFVVFRLIHDLVAQEFIYSEEVERQQEQRQSREQAMASSNRLIACSNWAVPVLEGFEDNDWA